MKIIQMSSWKKRCGIAVYAKQLRDSLRKLGHSVDVVDFDAPRPDYSKYDIVHVQYEPILINDDEVAAISRKHPKTIVTAHRVEANRLYALGGVKKIITLRDFNIPEEKIGADRLVIMPMGCDVYSPKSKVLLRTKFGFPADAVIASTFGFLVGWKQLDYLLDHLAPRVEGHPLVHLQFVTSYHFKFQAESETTHHSLLRIAKEHGMADRVKVITDWLPDEEILDRLHMSDIGFIHAPMNTGSASAAAEKFVSARLPVVISESNHFNNLKVGCWRGPMDLEQYIPVVVDALASSRDTLRDKAAELEKRYQETNWDVVGKMHEDLYKAIP